MMKEMVRSYSVLLCLFLSLIQLGMGILVLTGNNVTMSFKDIEANFAPAVKRTGECGVLYVADPIDACSPLINKVDNTIMGNKSPFVLIIRGNCSFDDKVKKAQAAGYKAAIIYDDVEGDLVSMAGDAAGIHIHAIFITKSSGETLTKYAKNLNDIQLCILPSIDNSAWSIVAISFISLLAMSALLATCYFVRSHTVRRDSSQDSPPRERQGMSARRVRAMPSSKFKAVVTEESSTSATCAICLEDYRFGDKLRILPCCHKFHAYCVDGWLTSWRTFCPVCKRDARTITTEPPASENTPLLSSYTQSSFLSSFRSSLASSSAIQIAPTNSHIHTHSPYLSPRSTYSVPNAHHSLHSPSRNSPHLNASRSTIDLGSSSPYSMAYPSVSRLNTTRCMSPYMCSPMNGSSYMGSSSRQQNPLHISESTNSFSPFNSAQSLPEC